MVFSLLGEVACTSLTKMRTTAARDFALNKLGEFMRVKELHFGVIGWGYWGPKVARNLDTLPNGMVTIVADMDEHRLVPLSINQP